MSDPSVEQLLFFNGINGDSGDYEIPPMSADELLGFIRGKEPPENLSELRFRYQQRTARHLGVKEGVDPKDLGQAGWGVIFAHDADPALQEALGELIELRREQAGDLFQLYAGGDGHRPDESKGKFLARHGAGPGPADPQKVPYYLLIVGSPQEIPYRFQSQLDVQYAVGRIHFETVEEYANYARSVVAADSGQIRLPRRAAFFGVANADDRATQLSAQHLVEPLAQRLEERVSGWQLDSFMREQATKATLAQLLSGEQTPALLFSASHGMGFDPGSSRQLPHQGALLCQDWPGPQQWREAIPQEFYFAGDDLEGEANLSGLIAFFFACYGAGTPGHDEFAQQAFSQQRAAIAPHSFLARLPSAMLAHPRGGALAAVGHVERVWGYSFLWPGAGAQTTVFESTLEGLLKGHPVGLAVEYFNERYAELATVLGDELEEIDFGKEADPYEMAGMWTANNDARGYAIIGDPAVRLPVVAAGEESQERPVITMRVPAGARDITAPLESATVADGGTIAPPKPEEGAAFNVGDAARTAAMPALRAALRPSAESDLKGVTVKTFTAADVDDAEKRQLLVETRLVLDGDVETVLSTTAIDVDPQLVALHRAVLKEAVAARLAFLKLLAAMDE